MLSISIQNLIDPEAVREFNYALWERGVNYVVVAEGMDDPEEIKGMIASVQAAEIEAILSAVPPFRLEFAEHAWAHFMAATVSQQLWPDGNHRTGFLTFDAVMRTAASETISMDPATADAMLTGSKAIIHGNPTPPGLPVFTLEEVADPTHPLRENFSQYAGDLNWSAVE